MLNPYRRPEIAQRISPIPHEVLETETPFNIKIPARHITHDKMVKKFGFFFTRKYITTGTVIQDKFSKKA